jgi:hypothetical protein
MLNEVYSNKFDYLVLVLGLSIGLVVFFGYFGVPALELTATIGFCIFYFLWGVIHHSRQGDLHIKIVLEYLLVSALAAAVLISLIIRS